MDSKSNVSPILIRKREETQIHPGRRPCDDRGRHQSDAPTNQGTPRTASNTRSWKRPSSRDCRKSTVLTTPWFGASSLQNRENKFLLFQANFVVLCYGHPSKLIHTPVIQNWIACLLVCLPCKRHSCVSFISVTPVVGQGGAWQRVVAQSPFMEWTGGKRAVVAVGPSEPL